MKLYIVYVLLLGTVLAAPAADISELRITDCNCDRCLVTQIGYPNHGVVNILFNGGQVTCSKETISDNSNIVIGFTYNCPISNSLGVFQVSYSHGHQVCGKNYDRVELNNCSGTPCSNFG